MTDDDLDLVERFQRGDVASFDLLVNKYQNKIYDIVYFHTHNVEDAYDLSQDIFFRAFKSLGRFEKKSSFYTWLYKITINACIDYGRQSTRFQTVPLEEWTQSYDSEIRSDNSQSYSPVRALELQELKQQITKAIDQLPTKQRAVFIMKRIEGMSLEEISKILGCSIGTVKAHVSHATSKLVSLLEPYLKK